MAKNIQEAEVVVTLNGQAAKNTINQMTQEYNRLRRSALEAYKAGQDALGKKLDAQAQKLMKDIQVTRVETKKFADILKNVNGASLKELRGAAKQLQSEIAKLKPGTQEFITKTKQLKEVNTRINQLTASFKGLVAEEKAATFSMKGLADGFNKYFGMMTAGVAAVTGLSMAFRKCAEDAAKLDDTYSDVMKTTGLLHDEVADLDKELMKIDTRTSREQLLLLARDAGKLGISGKENILGFVRAADQIQVALGEDLGDGAIKNLGKIADVLGYTQSMGIEKALLSIGSAVNAVGQASTASEAYLVEFTQRLAGVAAQTNISAANIIGFASGLDQSAMKVEMASTAFQKFLMKLYEDPAKFAEYAGLEVEKFSDLLKNDANQAIVTILTALKDKDGFGALVPIFKDMGLDGARAVSVLAAMATNINAVTEAQALANVEFEKATSVGEEYNVKNQNMQAQLEKVRKKFQNASIALGQSLNPIMLKSTKLVTYLIKALATYGKEIKAAAIAVAALTVVIKANAIAEGIRNAALKIGNVLNKTGVVTSNALRLGYFKLTNQTLKAAAAQKAMNTAMSKSVFGVIAITVAVLAGAIAGLARKNKEAAETTKELTEKEYRQLELQKKIASAKSEEAGKISALVKLSHDENLAYAERVKALNELKKIVPDYHASLTREGKLINDNITAIENYVTALKKEAVMDVLKEEFGAIESEKVKLEREIEKLNKSIEGEEWISEDYEINKDVAKTTTQVLVLEQKLKGLKAESDEIEAMIEKAVATDFAGGTTGGNGDGGGSGSSNSTNSAYQEELKDLKRHMQERQNLTKELYAQGRISKEEYDQKMIDINMSYLQRQVELAKEYGEDETQVMSAWLDAQIAANDRAYDEILKQKQDWEQANQKDFEKWQKEFEEMQAQAKEIRDQLNPQAARANQMADELANLDKLHEAKLLSEEEYEQAVSQLRKRYSQQDLEDRLNDIKSYVEKSHEYLSYASNFVTALKEAETQKLEAEYQKQLTDAGDNAEEREAIEAEYEQKKLDLQKKYADVDMAINIAKTIASGAAAAIKAYQEGGPYAGVALAAMIAATTAAEVATIVQQRNAIKNASVSSSSNTSDKTGSRTVIDEGYAEGGYTEDHTTLTTVGERGREWVAPHWMVQKHPVHFANLERYRKAGSHGRSGSMSRGFADGGYTPGNAVANGSGTSANSRDDIEAAVERAIVRSMANGAIRAFLVRNDITELDKQTERFKKQTSR